MPLPVTRPRVGLGGFEPTHFLPGPLLRFVQIRWEFFLQGVPRFLSSFCINYTNLSASGGLCPPDPLPGLCPWTLLGEWDSPRPHCPCTPTPFAEPTHFKIPGLVTGSVEGSPSLKQDIEQIKKVQRQFTKRLYGLSSLSYKERLQHLKLPNYRIVTLASRFSLLLQNCF